MQRNIAWLFCSQKRHTKKEMLVMDATKYRLLFCSQKRHTKKELMLTDATKYRLPFL